MQRRRYNWLRSNPTQSSRRKHSVVLAAAAPMFTAMADPPGRSTTGRKARSSFAVFAVWPVRHLERLSPRLSLQPACRAAHGAPLPARSELPQNGRRDDRLGHPGRADYNTMPSSKAGAELQATEAVGRLCPPPAAAGIDNPAAEQKEKSPLALSLPPIAAGTEQKSPPSNRRHEQSHRATDRMGLQDSGRGDARL